MGNNRHLKQVMPIKIQKALRVLTRRKKNKTFGVTNWERMKPNNKGSLRGEREDGSTLLVIRYRTLLLLQSIFHWPTIYYRKYTCKNVSQRMIQVNKR